MTPTYTCPEGHTSQSSDYCDVCGAPIGAAAPSPAGSSPGPSPGAGPGAGPGGSPTPGPHTSPLSLDADPGATRAGPRMCPNCGFENLPGALFCEDCGYDFTTGQLPAAAGFPGGPPAPGDPMAASGPGPLAPPAPLGPVDGPGSPSGPAEWVVEVWVDPDWYAAQDVSDPMPSAGMPLEVPLTQRSVLVGRTSTSRNIHPQVDLSADNGVSRRHAQLTTDGQRWFVEDLQSSNGTYVGNSGDPMPTTPISPGQRVELDDDDRVYLGAWTRLVVRRATTTSPGTAGNGSAP